MKEVCRRTGLTDRAVRLYIDNGLLSPAEEENYTGRRSIHFSEEDVAILDTIAILRKADFSVFNIRDMQASPERVHLIVEKHKEKLAADIENKQSILRNLGKIDGDRPMDYTEIAAILRQSASGQFVPKEDSVMHFKDFQRIIKNRIFSVIAFALLLVGTVLTVPLLIKGAFADYGTWSGGGIYIDYTFTAERFLENVQLLASGALMAAALVLLFVHIIRGKKGVLIAGAALCILSGALLLFLPDDIRKALYNYEFMNYRFSFMGDILHSNTAGFDYFIQSLKFIPLIGASVLSVIGAVREQDALPEDMQ